MPAYNFQERFIPFVLDGSKTHTIRGLRKDGRHPKAGQTFFGYRGMRTTACTLLIQAPLARVQQIIFERARVWVDEAELDGSEKDAFAWRDGFRNPSPRNLNGCFEQMLQFWVETRKPTTFEGHLIHWDFDRRAITLNKSGEGIGDLQ